MKLVCADMEGIFTPEIWIQVSKRTGIAELRLTTRDISDYDVLMKKRLGILADNGIKLKDITDVIEKKLAALDCLVSQGYGGAYARKRIETSDGAFGTAAGCAYAESFISMNAELHYYLPLTKEMLAVAQSSDHERMARYA